MSYINVAGFEGLQAFLDALPAKVEANIMRSALRAGAVIVAKKAKEDAPDNTGKLKANIRVSARLSKGVVTASAKVGSKSAWYWHFIEYSGAKPHKIRANKGKALAFAGRVYKYVQHPGMKAKPFLRPALYTQQDDVLNAVTEQIKKRLTKEGINLADQDIEVTV